MQQGLKQAGNEHGPPPQPKSKASLGKTSILIAASALILNIGARGMAPYLLNNESINPGEFPSYVQKSAVVAFVIAVLWIRFLAYPCAVAIAAMGISQRGGDPFPARIGSIALYSLA